MIPFWSFDQMKFLCMEIPYENNIYAIILIPLCFLHVKLLISFHIDTPSITMFLHICRSSFVAFHIECDLIHRRLKILVYILLNPFTSLDLWHERLLCIKLQNLCTSSHVTKENNFPFGFEESNITF